MTVKFEELNKINVNDHTEDKNGLTYLSWVYAWSELKKNYENVKYEIKKFENNLPYVYDENTGYMVFTEMTIDDLTYEMWLPVMDGNNKAMLNHSYTYKVKEYKDGQFTGKYIEKEVAPANMFDINKTIMRCLVKNIAMFGLGIYIYAGEDYPEGYEMTQEEAEAKIVNFGKYKGMTLKEVKEKDNNYLYWILDNDANYISEGLKSACIVLVDPIVEQDYQLANEFNNLLLDLEIAGKVDRKKVYQHFKVEDYTKMTNEQLKDGIKMLNQKKGDN